MQSVEPKQVPDWLISTVNGALSAMIGTREEEHRRTGVKIEIRFDGAIPPHELWLSVRNPVDDTLYPIKLMIVARDPDPE